MAGRLICVGHHPHIPVAATEFCTCEAEPVYLCLFCSATFHQVPAVHAHFPLICLEQYIALGKNKAALKQFNLDIETREKFFARAVVQEATIPTEANRLIIDFAKGYQGLLDRNHRCFLTLVDQLNREIDLLMTKREVDLSPIAQMIVERSQTLGVKEETSLCLNPDSEELVEFREHCFQAVANPGLREYEEKVRQTFRKQMQGEGRKLVAVYANKVLCYEFKTGTWKDFFASSVSGLDAISVDDSSASTFIPPNRIFVCGGGSDLTPGCNLYADYSAYMLIDDGTHQQLPNMATARQNPGVVWDPTRDAVYVFGGFWGDSINMNAISSGEKFQSNAWTAIASMHESRYDFNPCLHNSLVYLCSMTVEVYDPQSDTCTILNFTLPEVGTAVDNAGVLTVLSSHYISKLHHEKLIIKQCKDGFGHQSKCSPVVFEGVAYFATLSSFWGVDLNTGVVMNEGKVE